jgi:hypothetical protein
VTNARVGCQPIAIVKIAQQICATEATSKIWTSNATMKDIIWVMRRNKKKQKSHAVLTSLARWKTATAMVREFIILKFIKKIFF